MLIATRRRTTSAGIALAALVVLATGCSEVEQAARDTASDAASEATCTVANKAAEEAKKQAAAALDQIGADPEAAQRKLRAVRSAVVGAAETGISQDAKDQLARLETALDDLIAQADRAREGTPVDDRAVSEAQRDLDDAVAGVRNVC